MAYVDLIGVGPRKMLPDFFVQITPGVQTQQIILFEALL